MDLTDGQRKEIAEEGLNSPVWRLVLVPFFHERIEQARNLLAVVNPTCVADIAALQTQIREAKMYLNYLSSLAGKSSGS